MSTGLRPENEKFVVDVVQAGTYRSRDEVLDEALTLLREREETRRKVNAGIEQAERGELLDGDEVFERLEARAREIVAGSKNPGS
ncbi:MAG: type II toxin-antitoxin system ParD family antitoxin [Pirellulales bacterium]|nr:type II toxin-antitoxin system ParD family antitoxin [Pirellulales bacterium]